MKSKQGIIFLENKAKGSYRWFIIIFIIKIRAYVSETENKKTIGKICEAKASSLENLNR